MPPTIGPAGNDRTAFSAVAAMFLGRHHLADCSSAKPALVHSPGNCDPHVSLAANGFVLVSSFRSGIRPPGELDRCRGRPATGIGRWNLDSSQLAGNLYVFSQIGAPRSLKFHTMSSPMVVLFGAGISFVFGFVLLRVRVLRHVLTVLTAGLILAAVGLWNSAPLELLMQPMIVGLLFPLVAVLIEGWFRRGYTATVLTLPTPAELAAAHGSRDEVAVPPAAEQSTTLRPPFHDRSEALRIEAGSGVS